MKIVQLKYIILFLFVLFYTGATAQQLTKIERKAIAKETITNLKGGALVLRLKSKRNKISKLEELLAKKGIKESVKKDLKEELESTINERNRYNLSLIEAFEEHYTFSDIFYMYDSAAVQLKNGTREGIFLNKNLELDPTISIENEDFFVAKIGTTDSSTTTGVEAMVIMDKNLKDLVPPFPYYVRVNSIDRLFTRIFNHKSLVRKDAKVIVKRLESKLWRFSELNGG